MSLPLSRRSVLMSGLALSGLAALPLRAATPELRALVRDVQLLPESYGPTALWTFDGAAPGPVIRARQGERINRRLVNDLPQATSVHWHGIRIDNAMDGVAGLTQAAVPPGETFDYDFEVPDAGTYWYHSHNRSFEQVARGLYGALIVDEADAPDVDADEVLVLDDWRVDPQTEQVAEPFGAFHDLSHAGRIGNYVTTNGTYNLSLSARQNDRLRLRLVNAANARVFQLSLEGMTGWIVALDGMPLATPAPADGPLVLGPAQRVDLMVDVIAAPGETAHLVQSERGESFSQVAFEVTGQGAATPRPAPGALPPNRVAVPDLAAAATADLRMEGGAMGGMRSAMMNGAMTDMRDMAQAGMFWAFNGAVGGMDAEPLARLALGESWRLRLVNDTAFPHAMHLHGMHFHELDAAGRPGAFRDTTMVAPGETREIALVADNPGRWLLHCHMLEHAASGMMAWIDVAA